MTTAFKPAGEVAVWKAGYERLLGAGVDYGTFHAHEALAAMFGMALAEYLKRRGPLYRAMKQLEQEHGRTLVPVPREGYRVSHPKDHAELALIRKARGRRQAVRAVRLIEATDQAMMSDSERQRLASVEHGLVFALRILTTHERRINRHEEALRRAGLL